MEERPVKRIFFIPFQTTTTTSGWSFLSFFRKLLEGIKNIFMALLLLSRLHIRAAYETILFGGTNSASTKSPKVILRHLAI